MVRSKPRKSNKLFYLTLLLMIVGVINVANVSAPNAIREFSDKFYFVKQHIIWFVIAVSMMVVSAKLSLDFWKKISVPLFLLTLVLLIVVAIPSLGTEIYGARRWLIIGGISVQPSEIAKLTLALYLAKVASRNKGIASYLVPLGLIGFLIMLQPDLGTTILIAIIGFTQIFISGLNLTKIFLVSFSGVSLVSLLVYFSEYRRSRLMTFLTQTTDPLGEGYHIRQILIALSSGGLFGIGLGQSRQKFLFLPEVCSDSVFAIIAEELGFVGATLVIILMLAYIYETAKILIASKDKYNAVLVSGILGWFSAQTFLNIGSMVALVPLTGIPLPFLSCGGSSLVMLAVSTGILLAVSKDNHEKK